jgi:hypothetical protein
LTLARLAKRRGEATSARFSSAVLSLASGGGGGNDSTAFIEAHPDWRPEVKNDYEVKEEG